MNFRFILFVFSNYLYQVRCGNVETRIHKVLKPWTTTRVKFGISLESDRNMRQIYVGGGGGFYSCPLMYDSMNNGTEVCTTRTAVSDMGSKVGYEMTKVSSPGGINYLLICGNQYQFACPDLQIEQRMTGECYSYSITDGVQEQILTPCPLSCPQGLVADLMFVVDASGSVSFTDFRKGLDWIITILKQFSYDIDKKNLHVGYVIFSDEPYIIENPAERTFYEIKDEILAVWNAALGTDTHEAILAAQNALSNGRDSVTKIMITITDGKSNHESSTVKAAKDARDAGIVMVAVGVGNGVSIDELRSIANDFKNDTRVMTVTNYNNLATIIDQLSQVIKETAATGLEGATSNSTTELTNCQFGTSVTASSDGFYIGAPGSYDRTGTIAEFPNLNSFPDVKTSGHINNTKLASMLGITTKEVKDAYFGYSVATGNFRNDNRNWIITGGPRYLSRGIVLIYEEDDKSSHTALRPHDLSGHWQLGAYYGHSVLAMDLNNDDYDDLIVSAPLYSEEAGYDEGIVFVYMNDRSSLFGIDWTSPGFAPVLLRGSGTSGSRFGMTIVSGGDIDQNGYNDVIIGASSEKESLSDGGSGAVYIYFSSDIGLNANRVQRILGKSIQTGNTFYSGFGTTIHGEADFDSNGYPDVAISAPSSETVILLRAREMVVITLSVSVSPSPIDIISCANNLDTVCSTIQACVSARHQKRITGSPFDMSMNITLDSLIFDNIHKRFLFLDSTSSLMQVPNIDINSLPTCRQYRMQFNPDSLGKVNGGGFSVTPQVQVSVDLSDNHKKQVMSGVLNPLNDNTQTADWNFVKGCSGLNERCDHDLELTGIFSEPSSSEPIVLVGRSKTMHVNYTIKNNGPDHAYFLKINISSGYLTVHQIVGSCVTLSEEESDPFTGSAVINYQSSASVFKDLMPAGASCHFTVYFDFSKLQSTASEPQLKIEGKIYSNAGGETVAFDNNLANNVVSYSRSLQYKSTVYINKVSTPENVFFHPSDNASVTALKTLEDDILGGPGSNFHQTYLIYNYGPLGLSNAKVRIRWPEMTQKEHDLLYLIDVNCQPDDSCLCDKRDKTNKYRIAPNVGSIRPYYRELELKYPDAFDRIVSSEKLNCGNSICNEIICELSKIDVYEKISVSAFFKPWTPTFGKEFTKVDVYTSFTLIPANSTLELMNTDETLETTLTSYDPSNPPPDPPTNAVNIGAIIGGIIGGIVALIIAAVIMWKAGFFKSKYKNMTREARKSVRESQRGNVGGNDLSDPTDGPMTSDPEFNKSTEQLY